METQDKKFVGITRRSFAAAASAIAVASMQSAARAQSGKPIEVWRFGGPKAERDYVSGVDSRFKGSPVVTEFQGWETRHQKIASAAAAGSLPSVLALEHSMVAELASRNVVVDLNTAMPESVTAWARNIEPKFFDLGRSASVTADRSAAALEALKACEDFVVYLQTINAPTDGVYLVVEPRTFQDIRALGVANSATTAMNMQPMFGGVAMAGGLGAALTQGLNKITDSLDYMGVKIMKNNHLPIVDYSVNDAAKIGENRYNLNFLAAGVCGLLFQKSAVASLKLQGLKVDTVDDIRRNTTFTVASMIESLTRNAFSLFGKADAQ